MEKGILVPLPLPPRPSGILPFCLAIASPGMQIHSTVNNSQTTPGERSVPFFPVHLPKPLMDSKVKKKGPLQYLLVFKIRVYTLTGTH